MTKRPDKTILLIFLFSIVTVVAAIGFVQIASAVALADPGDQFVVNSPKANSTLVETVNIQFKLFDDENITPDYEIALYQTNCISKYGVIASNDYSIKDANNVYTKSFNTDGAMIDRSAPADGKYCLKVCTTLLNGAENYSVCDLRQVTLAEKVNNVPVITSTPPNSNYIVGQRFGYDVNATDADGDVLSYLLVNAPDWLQINSSTGEITSKGELSVVGNFGVLVYVEDGKGGRASQQFEVVVVDKPAEQLPSVEITSPKGDDLVVEDKLNIKWEIKGLDGIGKIELFYSLNGEDWTLVQSLTGGLREYEWDLSQIEDGEYYLRIVVTDARGNTYEYVLDPFSINRPGDENIENAARIIDVSPSEDSEVESLGRIEATLVPSKGEKVVVASLIVLLDDGNISESCVIQSEKLVCNVEGLADGKHKIDVTFEDTAGQKGQKTWFFTIAGVEEPKEASGIGTSQVLIGFLICMVALFLIIIPWILYSIWSGNRNEEIVDYDYTGGDIGGAYAPAPDVNVNIDPRTDLDSSYYNEPLVVTDTPVGGDYDSNYDEYAVGEGDIGGSQDFAPVEPAPVEPVAPAVNVTSEAPVVNVNTTAPAGAEVKLDPGLGEDFDEKDIPDWLKGDDISDPVDNKGQQIDLNTADEKKEDLKGADPYSDYGLAQKDD